MEIERGLFDWQQSVVDSGLEVDEETAARVDICQKMLVKIYPVLMTSFGPMNNPRIRPPVLAFFDIDSQLKMRLFGPMPGMTTENYAGLASQFVLSGAWIAYSFWGDAAGIAIENGRMAKVGEWSAKLGVSEDDFMRYAMIEEITHACLMKYPYVNVRPLNEDANTYAGLVERIAKILGQEQVALDPAEFWVAFGIGLLEPNLRKLNDKVLSNLLVYLTDIESGKKEPNIYWLKYAAAHLTTRAAFDLIGDNDAAAVLRDNPTLLTEPEKLVENFVLPVRVRQPV